MNTSMMNPETQTPPSIQTQPPPVPSASCTTNDEETQPSETTTNPSLPSNRFELELEFIQSLASPAYIHHLATQGYYQDPAFLSFLQYLQYWKKPPYVKFITYPHCFTFLDLICESELFRREICTVPFRNFVHEQQFYSWQYRSRTLYGSGRHGNEGDDGTNGGDGVTTNTTNTTTQDGMVGGEGTGAIVTTSGSNISNSGTAPSK